MNELFLVNGEQRRCRNKYDIADVCHCAFIAQSLKTPQQVRCDKKNSGILKQFTTHNSQFTKAIAFTLAETLIVMGIIGVVAALTLPNLNSSTGDREKVAKVKKIYQNLTDAHGRLEGIYGPVTEWNCSAHGSFTQCYYERLSDVLKISKKCTESNCNLYNGTGEMELGYILSDGLQISSMNNGESSKKFLQYLSIFVNITDSKKNTVPGKDTFRFILNTDSTITPDGINDLSYCPKVDYPSNDVTNEGWSCTAWVINFGNMDYLKTDSSGKCTNNKNITLDGVNNTTCK